MCYTEQQLEEFLAVGYSNIKRETINAPVTVETGVVPRWLNGNFIRHSCGVFGETEHKNAAEPNYIGHLFDCFEIGSKFRLWNGQVTFTNRWYDTVVNDIYNFYGRDMNKSSLFVSPTFAKANASQIDKWEPIMTSSKVAQVPHVSWWRIGNEAVAMSEGPTGIVVDPNDVKQHGPIRYQDDNMGVPRTSQYLFSNNPAHEQTDLDGTLWSTTGLVKFVTSTELEIKRIVYKVGTDKVRRVVGEFHYARSNLSLCHGNTPYPNLDARFGYLHSFAFTQNYVILPETAFMDDPCVFTRYDRHKGFFTQGFRWEPKGFSRLLVMRKSDGQFISAIKTIPFFVTHQFGSYEDGPLIHMDMLTYDNADIYTYYTYVDNLQGQVPYSTNVTRMTLDTRDWTVSFRNIRTAPSAALEMSVINMQYNTQPYTYGYMIRNFDRKEQNSVIKLNMQTGFEIEYTLPEGMYAQEPQFVARPRSLAEDDGVLLVQGVDGRKRKAFMLIIDAVTMALTAHVTAPDVALFGLHNRFFPFEVGQTETRNFGLLG